MSATAGGPAPTIRTPPRVDALFQWFERLHTGAWGDVLDAGTGMHSLGWLASQPARSLTAVTVEAWRMPELRATFPEARLVEGEWTDPALLAGEAFDTVLVDYVLGAMDGHTPFFQYHFLDRLRPHCRRRVYLVGLEPQPRDGSELDEVCRVRDACILLAGHRTYREYPRDLVLEWLGRAGYRVLDSEVFPNRLGARFVHGQLDVATRKLAFFKDPALREVMAATIANLRERALARGERTWGSDYVIAAEIA